MARIPKFSRRARWAVPAGALAVTGAVIAGVLVPSAQASPVLPARTAAQLLAAVSGRTGSLPAFTGTVVENAALGLPQLPGQNYATSLTSLLSGNHTVKIWYADPGHVRLAVPQSLTESDVIINGDSAWYWQSTTSSVTHVLLNGGQDAKKRVQLPSPVSLTPQQAARQAIEAVGPTTRVTTQTNITVAGEPAYQLVLAPKSAGSLIGSVRIAVDATHHVPLRVQIYSRHAASPAFQVGFTSISFVRPAASNFDFTPPPGSKVDTVTMGQENESAKQMTGKVQPATYGSSWLTVVELPASDLSDALRGMAGHSASRARFFAGSSSQAAPAAAQAAQAAAGTPGAGPGGLDVAGLFGILMQSGKKVHGAWGNGQLLHTSLLNVLMTSNGRVFLGAVTPSVLYQAAAHIQ
jgi:outer membrane lipoprotein-sorting protein